MVDHHEHEHFREFDEDRVTSPMQPYSTGRMAVGAVVALVGLSVTFGLPLLLL